MANRLRIFTFLISVFWVTGTSQARAMSCRDFMKPKPQSQYSNSLELRTFRGLLNFISKGLAATVVKNEFTVDRDLNDYAGIMSGQQGPYDQSINKPSLFLSLVKKLGPLGHWLDVGGGEGHAPEALLSGNFQRGLAAGERAPSPEQLPNVTTVSFGLTRQVPTFGGKLRTIAKRFIENISNEEIGKVNLITDVYGAFSYTDSPGALLRKYHQLLSEGGEVLLVIGSKADQKTFVYNQEGVPVKIADWLIANMKGFEIEVVESKFRQRLSDIRARTEGDLGPETSVLTLRLKKTTHPFSIPELMIVRTNLSNNPPMRGFIPTNFLNSQRLKTLTESLLPTPNSLFVTLVDNLRAKKDLTYEQKVNQLQRLLQSSILREGLGLRYEYDAKLFEMLLSFERSSLKADAIITEYQLKYGAVLFRPALQYQLRTALEKFLKDPTQGGSRRFEILRDSLIRFNSDFRLEPSEILSLTNYLLSANFNATMDVQSLIDAFMLASF